MSATPAASVQGLEANSAFMDKYSRQIGAYGLEAMSKLLNMHVLVVGVKSVGMETAKNLALAGPGGITLWDDTPATMRDLGGNFFLNAEDVGKPRASAVAGRLQELNQMVTVRVHQGPLTEDVLRQHTAVVWCNGTRDELQRWDAVCRSHKIAFIAVGTLGATGYVFSDFGPSYTIRDANGEAVATRIVTDISNAEEAVVTLLGAADEEGGRMHGMEESDHDGWVEIRDVEGMDGPNGKGLAELGPFNIKTCTRKTTVLVEKDGIKTRQEKSVFDPYRLVLSGADTRAFSKYLNGGVMTQVKVPVTRSHRSFADNLAQPAAPGSYGLLFTDGAKFGRAEQLHLGLLGIWEFQARHGQLPGAGDEAHAQEVVELARAANAAHKSMEGALIVDEVDADAIKAMALYAAVELQPLCAYFGGVVAQEVVKATGKFSPLNQWLHLDFLEVLPDAPPPPAERAPRGTRYDDLVAMFGAAFVRERLMAGRTFMVGCGALGCEFLKNFALLGFACGPGGLITVTDNDRIEVSNLSRQFLFREHNVGQPKSAAATAAVRATMNPDIQVVAHEHLVAPHTEHLFPDQFWEGLHFVTNALDNVKARLYVDSRCVFYAKPLLESGTLGTKCNVQVVLPHVTASYADGPKDQADEDSIPMCTLRNFPSLIEHCIEWARAQFEDMFVATFAEAKKFCADKNAYIAAVRAATLDLKDARQQRSAAAKALDDCRRLAAVLRRARGATFESCLAEAFDRFHEMHRDRVLQLVHNFPEDHMTDAGERFWTGAKRFPQAADLDVAHDEDHINFITSAANILAAAYGVVPPPERGLLPPDHPQRDRRAIAQVVAQLDVPMWEPTGDKVDLSDGTEEEKKDGEGEADADAETDDGSAAVQELSDLLCELERLELNGLSVEPAEFEKDQDLNFHIDFITAASNLRAWNYRIAPASRHAVKMIAGKIIPAIATTTASVCGLVMIELLKVLQGKPLAAYKDSSNNLGLNSYFFSEPVVPEKAKDEYDPINLAEVKCRPPGFTKWDKTVIDAGELTLRQFLGQFRSATGLNCMLVLHTISESEGPQRGLLLYDAEAWNPRLKAVYEAAMDRPLREWVAERYAPAEVITAGRKYVELQVACADDEDQPYRVPTVVYRWAK